MRLKKSLLALAIAMGASAAAHAFEFSNVYVLGDS